MALVLAVNGQAVRVNRAFVDRFGPHGPALPGPPWTDLLSVESREALQEFLAHQHDFTLLLQLCAGPRGNARAGWLACSARWRVDTANYLCLLHDVTGLREAELLARAQAARIELLADNVPALMAYYEVGTFHCKYANSGYAETFGWNREAVLGHTVAEIIGEAAAQQIQPQVDTVLQQRRAAAYERQMPLADGGTRWIDVNLLPHLDEHGEPVGCFVLISDITRCASRKSGWASSCRPVPRASCSTRTASSPTPIRRCAS